MKRSYVCLQFMARSYSISRCGAVNMVERFCHNDSKSSTASLSDRSRLGEDPRKRIGGENATTSHFTFSDDTHTVIDKKREESGPSSTNGLKQPLSAKEIKPKKEGWSVKVDKSGLLKYGAKWPSPIEWTTIEKKKETATPIVQHLRSIIKQRGPMSVHDFMSQALHHAEFGYYQRVSDKIGSQGDFVTSPEISQLFGQTIGIWCVAVWQAMGQPAALNLVEIGPGKGTLMRDILGIIKQFPALEKSVTVHLVEISEFMRTAQHETLCKPKEATDPSAIPVADKCEARSTSQSAPHDTQDDDSAIPPVLRGETAQGNVPVHWHSYLRHVPKGPAVYVGHEILDAFPVYQFVKTDGAWREKMVDVDVEESSPYHFRFVQAPNPTPATRVFFDKKLQHVSFEPLSVMRLHQAAAGSVAKVLADMGEIAKAEQEVTDSSSSELTLEPVDAVAAASVTGASTAAEDVAKGSSGSSTDVDPPEQIDPTQHGLHDEALDSLEVCPLAYATVEEIANNVREHGGAALLIDYGENYPQGDTIRGFKKHKAAHILSEPGNIDVTADVNFKACAQVGREQDTKVQGPITQGEFLYSMGIIQLAEQLIDHPDVSEEEAEKIALSTQRLLASDDPSALGSKFKVISIVNKSISTPGFGDQLS